MPRISHSQFWVLGRVLGGSLIGPHGSSIHVPKTNSEFHIEWKTRLRRPNWKIKYSTDGVTSVTVWPQQFFKCCLTDADTQRTIFQMLSNGCRLPVREQFQILQMFSNGCRRSHQFFKCCLTDANYVSSGDILTKSVCDLAESRTQSGIQNSMRDSSFGQRMCSEYVACARYRLFQIS